MFEIIRHAREPPPDHPDDPAGARAGHRARPRAGLRGDSAHHLPRHRRAQRRGRAGLQRARAGRGLPPARRLQDQGQRPDQPGGGGAVPGRPAWARRGTRPRVGHGRGAAQAADRPAHRTAAQRREPARPLSPRRAGLVQPRRRGAAPAADRRGRMEPAPDPDRLSHLEDRRHATDRAPRHRAQERPLVPGGRRRSRPGAHLSRLQDNPGRPARRSLRAPGRLRSRGLLGRRVGPL